MWSWSPPLSLENAAVLIALALASLAIANGIAAFLEVARSRRILRKLAAFADTAPAARPKHGALPITLITGFLGSGKTVLLNRLLREASGRRICVIENEAGSISIDHSLLKLEAAEHPASLAALSGVVVLANGCMCCSAAGAGDELERVLDKLVAIDSQLAGVDNVVIECSGMVDPAPIITTLLRPELRERFFLDSVVAVVDAKYIHNHFDADGRLSLRLEAGRQIAHADAVLINKIDTVQCPQRVDALDAAIRALNPSADVFHCSFGDVSPSAAAVLLGRGDYTATRSHAVHEALACAESSRQTPPHRGGHHAGGIAAVTIDLRGWVYDFDEFSAWLVDLTKRDAENIYRIKGLFYVDGAAPAKQPSAPAAAVEATSIGTKPRRRRGSSQLGARVRSTNISNSPRILCVVHGVHGDVHISAVGSSSSSSSSAVLESSASGKSSAEGIAVETALVVIGRSLDSQSLTSSFLSRVSSRPFSEGAGSSS